VTNPLDSLLGTAGEPVACKVFTEKIAMHWFPSTAKPGDPCLCGATVQKATNDFYEPDEPIDQVAQAFERGEKHLTASGGETVINAVKILRERRRESVARATEKANAATTRAEQTRALCEDAYERLRIDSILPHVCDYSRLAVDCDASYSSTVGNPSTLPWNGHVGSIATSRTEPSGS
jgi:hypothetical protein